MPSPLRIPGVQIRTEFEPAPVLPGATGVLGVVGVADRGPLDPTPLGSFGEFVDAYGIASRYTMPEVRTALANGVAEVVIARISPGRGLKATRDLLDDEGDSVVRLEARAEGTWGHGVTVKVAQVKGGGGGVKYVNVEISLDGEVIDRLQNLVMDPFSPNYLFDRINAESRVVVAYDPLFEKALPEAVAAPLADAAARAAFATLKVGTADVIRAEAKKTGPGGNLIGVVVETGRAGLRLPGAADAPSVDVLSRQSGPAGTDISVGVTAAAGTPAGRLNLTVTRAASTREVGPFATVDELVTLTRQDPDVEVVKLGDPLPIVRTAAALARRVDVTVQAEGADPRRYSGLGDRAAIAAVSDPGVTFTAVGATDQLPTDDAVPLTGGRAKGPALELAGSTNPQPLLELVAAAGVTDPLDLAITTGVSTIDHSTPVVNIAVSTGGEVLETFTDLTMDPDDVRYVPDVLEQSALVRAVDLFVREHAVSFPRAISRPVALQGGAAPSGDDYQDALDRLESAEEVDLVIASVHNQLADAQVRTVHQAVVAHCTKMADVARNRIGLGSVTASETKSPAACIDHADDVRSDHFVLAAPARMEGALAGLLGRQDYFQSPTFKTIASPGAPPGTYTDAQLGQLIDGNVLVINERRKLGIIVVKGVLTSGRDINVQRVANKAVRDVKAIADVYIGLLNNDGARNALRQQIVALLLQMERDGAIVPSVDFSDPAFKVDVYSTQADFANGIVRIDIATRPVREIKFIYGTILVQN